MFAIKHGLDLSWNTHVHMHSASNHVSASEAHYHYKAVSICTLLQPPVDAMLFHMYAASINQVVFRTLGVGGGGSSVLKILSQKRLVTPKPFS